MRLVRLVILLLVLTLVSTGLFAQNSKISPDLQVLLNSPNPPSTVNVIVQLNPPTFLQTIGGIVNGLVGGITNIVFDLIPGGAQVLPLNQVLNLVANPDVAYVSLDRPVRGALATATDYANVAVGANIAAGYGYTGKGVGVAIIDSGIAANSDLASHVVYHESFIGGTTKDDYGHGTHVAGIVAGNGASSNGA